MMKKKIVNRTSEVAATTSKEAVEDMKIGSEIRDSQRCMVSSFADLFGRWDHLKRYQ